MRVTNSMLVSNFMNNLNSSMGRLDGLQSQMATNKKFAHISDDPESVIYSRQARYKLYRLDQYGANVEMARDWLVHSEKSVLELSDILARAYEACVDAATDVKTETDKNKASEYIGQLRDQILHTLNTTFGDKYVYGGYNTVGHTAAGKNVPPFTVEGGKLHFNGVDLTDPANAAAIEQLRKDVLTFDVGPGIEIPVTLNGIDLAYGSAGGDDLFSLLDGLYTTVNSGAGADAINAFIPKLQEAQNNILAYAAELGGRTNRLEMLMSRYEQDEINYTQMKSDAEDADQAEIIMRYKMAEAVYKAALSTGAYIIQPTLVDFLR